jgi:hypothetical protein
VEKRREIVRRLAGAVRSALGALGALASFTAGACELPPGVRVESERLSISYWTIPAKIVVGEPFVLELAACPKTGAAVVERVKLDAHMPEHRHGMNYRTKVAVKGAGRFHSEGWLFHMPGRWEFLFDIGPERLTHSVRIE